MKRITSCTTLKDSMKFTDLAPPRSFVVDEIRMEALRDGDPSSENLLQETNDTRSQSKDKSMLGFRYGYKIDRIPKGKLTLVITVNVINHTVDCHTQAARTPPGGYESMRWCKSPSVQWFYNSPMWNARFTTIAQSRGRRKEDRPLFPDSSM